MSTNDIPLNVQWVIEHHVEALANCFNAAAELERYCGIDGAGGSLETICNQAETHRAALAQIREFAASIGASLPLDRFIESAYAVIAPRYTRRLVEIGRGPLTGVRS